MILFDSNTDQSYLYIRAYICKNLHHLRKYSYHEHEYEIKKDKDSDLVLCIGCFARTVEVVVSCDSIELLIQVLNIMNIFLHVFPICSEPVICFYLTKNHPMNISRQAFFVK